MRSLLTQELVVSNYGLYIIELGGKLGQVYTLQTIDGVVAHSFVTAEKKVKTHWAENQEIWDVLRAILLDANHEDVPTMLYEP